MYHGPERRKNRVMITANTEYHLAADRVVAVRDTRTRSWHQHHRAIGERLVGGIQITDAGSWRVNFDGAQVGERLCFSNDLMTTPVERISRPSLDTLDSYPVSGLR